MTAYYNEFDPKAAAWLRELVAAGHIAPGDVDERDIRDVNPDELRRYDQCHFFAGIGGWSLALRRAGWADDRPVWTGSCPCQPFSAAGKRGGTDDERHLWPAFFGLIRAVRPPVVFGEQVASSQVVGKQGKGPRVSRGLSPSAPGKGLDPARQGASSQAELGLRLGPAGAGSSGEDRSRLVRGDGFAVPADRRSDVGQPLDRPDQAGRGLHLPEHSSGLPRDEQRDGGLGRAETGGDGGGHSEETSRSVRSLVEEIGRTPDGEDEPAWLDVVFDDLERAGYACGAAVLPACGLGAPHIRQRLWFVGAQGVDHTRGLGWLGRGPSVESGRSPLAATERSGDDDGLADADGRDARAEREQPGRQQRLQPQGGGTDPLEHATGDGQLEWRAGADGRGAASGRGLGGLADANDAGSQGRGQPGRERAAERLAGPDGVAGGVGDTSGSAGQRDAGAVSGAETREHGARQQVDGRLPVGPEHAGSGLGFGQPGPVNGVWRDADWLYCRDGKWRPVEPGTQQMVDGLPEGLGHLRLECDGDNESGTTSEADPDQTLPRLRGETGAQAVQRHAGGSERIQETGLLRPEVHGAGLRGPDQSAERQELAAAVGEGAENPLREVRKGGASRPPQGLEPGEQHANQPREPLRFLSQAGTPPPGCFPLASGVRHRVGLLRGYGNAIVAPAAQAFIEATLEALDINPGIA